MEISKLRGDLERVNRSLVESQTRLAASESKVKSLEESYEAICIELEEIKERLEKTTESLATDSAARSAAENLTKSLQTELSVANAAIKTHEATISTWEKDYNTLKAMYRDSDAKTQEAQKKAGAVEREHKDLIAQVTELKKRTTVLENENANLRNSLEKNERDGRKSTGVTQQDDDDVDELEDAERRRLQHRIQQLETELFDERKKWHSSERQRLASPDQSPAFLDVDLNPAGAAGYDMQQQSQRGMQRRQQQQAENLYALEAEERRRQDAERIERVKDVKRGLVQWKGWRLDLTTVGGSGLNFGAMFEV